MKFHKGTSGSPKHTESIGRDIGGAAPAMGGPRIGPGAAGARVRPAIGDQVTRSDGKGADQPKGVSVYRAGSAPPKGYKQ